MQTSRFRLKVDIFAYVIATMAFCWGCLNGLGAWKMDLFGQMFIVLLLALVWGVMSLAVIAMFRWAAKREVARYADRVARELKEESQPNG